MRDTHVNRRIQAWGKVLSPRDHDLSEKMAAELAAERRHLLLHWGEHPKHWLWGVDPTTTSMELNGKSLYFPKGRPLLWTTDERDDVEPVKQFPLDKPHLQVAVDLLISHAPERRIVFINKSRQMLITTLCCLLLMWYCRFKPSRRCLISKTKESDSIEVSRDKIRTPYYRLPQWVQDDCPLPERPAEILRFMKTRSYIRCVTQNVAEAEGRGGTISVILVDEAARQYMFSQIMAAVLPAASRLWAVTTPDVGTPGATSFYEFWDEHAVEVER